ALTSGRRVFISGGAGGVGTFALQLARWLGAEVATTASPRGEALARRLGADTVVDYTRQRFEQVLRDYDGALDLVGADTLSRSFAVVKRGATVVSIAGMPEPETASKDLGGSTRLTSSSGWRASSPAPGPGGTACATAICSFTRPAPAGRSRRRSSNRRNSRAS